MGVQQQQLVSSTNHGPPLKVFCAKEVTIFPEYACAHQISGGGGGGGLQARPGVRNYHVGNYPVVSLDLRRSRDPSGVAPIEGGCHDRLV